MQHQALFMFQRYSRMCQSFQQMYWGLFHRLKGFQTGWKKNTRLRVGPTQHPKRLRKAELTRTTEMTRHREKSVQAGESGRKQGPEFVKEN